MQKLKMIRQETISAAGAFSFDVETDDWDNLFVAFNSSAESTAAPDFLIHCPTTFKREPLAQGANIGAANPPAPGTTEYYALGPDMNNRFPLPQMMTFGAQIPAGCILSITVFGTPRDYPLADPTRHNRFA